MANKQKHKYSLGFNTRDQKYRECENLRKFYECLPRGGHSAHTHTGGSVQEISGNSKISFQLHCNPKVSAHFILGNLHMNMKYPETMQIEVWIASSKPRNISSTMFDVKKYHEHDFSFIWTKKYHFGQYSDPKISDLPIGFFSKFQIFFKILKNTLIQGNGLQNI